MLQKKNSVALLIYSKFIFTSPLGIDLTILLFFKKFHKVSKNLDNIYIKTSVLLLSCSKSKQMPLKHVAIALLSPNDLLLLFYFSTKLITKPEKDFVALFNEQ